MENFIEILKSIYNDLGLYQYVAIGCIPLVIAICDSMDLRDEEGHFVPFKEIVNNLKKTLLWHIIRVYTLFLLFVVCAVIFLKIMELEFCSSWIIYGFWVIAALLLYGANALLKKMFSKMRE